MQYKPTGENAQIQVSKDIIALFVDQRQGLIYIMQPTMKIWSPLCTIAHDTGNWTINLNVVSIPFGLSAKTHLNATFQVVAFVS